MAARGRLRVLLGAAPGVGKTFAMLEEGHHLIDDGRDVVIALLETHDRHATADAAAGFEMLPRLTLEHHGIRVTEMDTAAVITRRPDVALVDELAHTNAPGSPREKRWQDVQQILDAGIDVVSTLNIQHIESLNDVVHQITGVPQHETVPDAVLRSADQVEVVDLAPQALRDRVSAGLVYPPGRIDAALSHYFRLGNLTALRELALLWIADDADEALQKYRREHGIADTWDARERIVVGLTGGPEGRTLLRRGSRIASRTAAGELIAVHVTSQDGLRSASPRELAAQRGLAESLGGSYHQIVGDDIAASLVDFARSVNATQLVIGVSRRGRLAAAVDPGIGATVTRTAGSIDVHIVNHDAAGRGLALPRLGGALSPRRRVAGFVLMAVAGPLLAWAMWAVDARQAITAQVLGFQLLVVVVALVGGVWPAVCTAVLSGFTLDYLFIEPLYTVAIRAPSHLVTLLLYVLIAALVSYVVDRAARTSRDARRAGAESELLQEVSGRVLRGKDAVQALVAQAREAFGMDAVRLTRNGRQVVESRRDGERPDGARDDGSPTVLQVGDDARLELAGPVPGGADRRLLSVICTQLAAALEHTELTETTASDRVRAALLAAVSHDLRRPLAAATTAVSGLRSDGGRLSPADRHELVETADRSLAELSRLVTDLLDVNRLQAGALTVSTRACDPGEVILAALDEVSAGPDSISLDIDPAAPDIPCDPALLQRALVNLLANALRHRPPGTTVLLSAGSFSGAVEIRVADHGPGISPQHRDDAFTPFQRLGDTDNTSGLGLGLALSKGFVEGMGGTLTPEDTPGGGLTMVITLPVAAGGSG